MKKEIKNYWTNEEYALLERARTFAELTFIARLILDKMKNDSDVIVQVCGPIGSGGKGSIEKNLKEFEKAIKFLKSTGLTVFDQIPFETPMQRIKATMPLAEAHRKITDDFYLPLMKERYIARYFFLYDWETSKGSKIEHERAPKYGISISYLAKDYEESYNK